MARTTKLNDIQRTLLTNAAVRDDGSLLPVPVMEASAGGASRSVAGLVKRGLAREIAAGEAGQVWRTAGDDRIGVVITDAGRAIIGVSCEPPTTPPAAPTTDTIEPAEETSPLPGASSKIGLVVMLLKRGDGATLAELVEATGWLPHTTRAALTGLRQKGHAIDRGRRDEVSCYHIAGAA